MTFELGLPKTFVRFAAIAFVAVGASACSSVPNWVDPTNWIGGSDQSASDTSSQSNAPMPDIASIPDKPVPPSTVDERKAVADSLKADRADAQYSADALRGGTEPSAAPPSDTPPAAESISASTSAPAAAPASETQTADAAPQPAPAATPPEPAAQSSTAPASTPAPSVQVANAAPSEPATSASAAAQSDDQLGFQQSKAPALDPTVAHFVSRSVMDQIRQTPSDASATQAPALTPPADPKPVAAQQQSSNDPQADGHARHTSNTDSGSFVTATRSSYSGMATPAAYTTGEQSLRKAVVFFPRDAAVLTTKAKAEVLSAARSYQSRQGAGFVRVVGHSSSRTGDMPMARHLAVVFQHSQDFATAVADELIRDGVPADKVLIEAVGDSQPVYYESMPQGEAGNRRAEILL
jgi:outer membrane protein OmpA-like peptidoglycan-associated protein